MPSLAYSATLQAKVVEVQSGNALVVSNINRPIRIRLKAVVPPENGQPFSEAAREHLKVLVFDRTVTVEYTDLAEGFLEAKVSVNGIDIGSQMLRDGVAWYDRSRNYELSEKDRDLYSQCEQAARNEKRGLWQDAGAVAPWEFRKAQLTKINNPDPAPYFRRSQARKSNAKQSLSNDDLLGAMMRSSSSTGGPAFRPITANGSSDRWTKFESEAEHFSILVPSNAVEGSESGPDPQGKPVAFHYLAANSDAAFYLLVSGRGPTANETDVSFIDQVIHGFIDGMNHSLETAGVNAQAAIKDVYVLKLAAYIGKQYTVSGPGFSEVIRILTKRVDGQRQFFMLCAMTRSGDGSLSNQFLNSFKISGQ